MFAHVSQHIEPGHRLHFDVSDHDFRLNGIELLDRLRRRVKWENLMSFFATEGDDHLYHRRFVIDNYDLSHGKSQRGEYFSFEKKKAVLRITLARPPEPAPQPSTSRPIDREQRSPRKPMSIFRTAERSNPPQNLNEFYQVDLPV